MKERIAVHVEDMTMAYASRPVLWDLDVDILDEKITAIIGPNGAGKSTFIKGILGIYKPISGEIRIFGKSYKEVYKQIAYIPQSGSVNWNFPTTVLDVVLMGRYIHVGPFRRYKKEDHEIAMQALLAVRMEEFKDRHISELSGGQKQRVFLARAIAQRADLYFMDEPLQGVDARTETIIMNIIQGFKKEGKAIVVVHHDLSTVADYFDEVVMLNKQVIAAGSVQDTFTEENIKKAYGE